MRPHAKTCPVVQAVCTCPFPESSEEIQIANDHFVGSTGSKFVQILVPPRGPIPYEQALRMAAWIVLVSDEERFEQILEAIKRGD